jgi:cardiolipin synthase A/B
MERLKGQVEPTDILQRHTLLIEVVSGSSLLTGNKVTLLIDGPATYDAMFKAIRNARDHINFETYMFDDDELGRRFADLLLQKQAEGVQVNLIYDGVGCMTTPSAFFQRLRDGGIDAAEFNPINPLKASRKRRNLLETLSPHLANSEVFVMDFSTVTAVQIRREYF